MKRLGTMIALVALLALAGWAAAQQDEDELYYVTFILPVNVRVAASTTSPIIGSLLPGEAVRVVGSVNGERYNSTSLWYAVDFNGRVGYVHSVFLSNPNAPTPTLVPTFTLVPPPPAATQAPQSGSGIVESSRPPVEAAAPAVEGAAGECRIEDLMTQMRAILLETTLQSEREQFEALQALSNEIRAMEAACQALFGGGAASPSVVEEADDSGSGAVQPPNATESVDPTETPVFDENAAG